MDRSLDTRVLRTQIAICSLVALLAAFWPLGSGLNPLHSVASALGALALCLPSGAFSVWSKRQVQSSAGAVAQPERAAQRVLGLAGLRIGGTMTLMVIAFALMRAQAQWVLVGIAAAALAQALAVITAGRSGSAGGNKRSIQQQ